MDKIIDKIYHDPAGHVSTKSTYEDAKAKDKVLLMAIFRLGLKRTLKEKLNSKVTIALLQASQKKSIKWISSS